jgi:hypothetical protein
MDEVAPAQPVAGSDLQLMGGVDVYTQSGGHFGRGPHAATGLGGGIAVEADSGGPVVGGGDASLGPPMLRLVPHDAAEPGPESGRIL